MVWAIVKVLDTNLLKIVHEEYFKSLDEAKERFNSYVFFNKDTEFIIIEVIKFSEVFKNDL